MCASSCWIIFWTTQYNTPHVFRLPTTQPTFKTYDRLSTTTVLSVCIIALACEGSHHYTTFNHTYWQVGIVVKSAPPVTFHRLTFRQTFQSVASKPAFFPQHLLPTYNRASTITLFRERFRLAYISPLLARKCRTYAFGRITTVVWYMHQFFHNVSVVNLVCWL